LVNLFEESAQDLQWTVSFWRLQDDAAEREAVCLSEDIVWWKGAEDIARSAQEPDLPPDDDEHGENAEADGHDGEAKDAELPEADAGDDCALSLEDDVASGDDEVAEFCKKAKAGKPCGRKMRDKGSIALRVGEPVGIV
jgi:hypothetical protein